MAATIRKLGTKKLQLTKTLDLCMQCLARFSGSKSVLERFPSNNSQHGRMDEPETTGFEFEPPPEPQPGIIAKYMKAKYDVDINSRTELGAWLQRDNDINDIDDMASREDLFNFKQMKKRQLEYIDQTKEVFGPSLVAAHVVLAAKGAVKFKDIDMWYQLDANQNNPLPRADVKELQIEAIDASNSILMSAAFTCLENLPHLRFLNLSSCKYIDDWSLAHLHAFQDSLEVLDISGCERVTEWGVASLQSLRNLKGLNLENLQQVNFLGLLGISLEELIPNLNIVGLTEADLELPTRIDRGERRLVRALLGLYNDSDLVSDKQRLEFTSGIDSTRRGVRRVDW